MVALLSAWLGCSAKQGVARPPGSIGGGADLSASVTDGAVTPPGGDASIGPLGGDASLPNVYSDLGHSDSGVCVPPNVPPASCASPIAPNAGCGPTEICGNGLDDNCNGQVDENCSCVAGAVQKCFLGPPGKHNVGACSDGIQTCQQVSEVMTGWGPCTNSIGPSPETCDMVDNDCNGCVDDGLCCTSVLSCPSPGDPRIADILPYTTLNLKGELFYTGMNAATWSWKIVGGPCDQLFLTTTGMPPSQSFTLTGASMRDATAAFTLSGDYTVTLTVTDTSGHVYTCTWVQHVVGPGVRFELCWDTTGMSDLDLHVHRPNSTTNFFVVGTTTTVSEDDCDYYTCKATSVMAFPMWGYADSPLAECVGGPEGPSWMGIGHCRNPRLDIDNISDIGKPENANVDNPKNGDSFRALVHYFGPSIGTTPVSHPMVNIYCGGKLKATYGQAPNLVQGFATAGGWHGGDMWRVADVVAIVDAPGTTTDCTVTAIHPMGATTGYFVGHDGKITFTGY